MDMFDNLLLAKFPSLTKEDLENLRQSIAGEVNKGKEEKRIIEFCKKKEAFVIDDMFLLKKYRKRIYEITKPYNPKIIIWYIESYSIENCIERRKGNINKDVILNMAEKLDFPAGEYADEIIYLKDVEK
jgi:predicted kinase